MQTKSKTPGIRVRHSRTCASRHAGCRCVKSYEAFVYLPREDRKLRKTFPTLAAAKAWRADATVAANQGRLRAPSSETVAEAWEAWHERAKAGYEPNRSGNPYKPAALRGYERAMRLRVLPVFGHAKLSKVTRAEVQAFADGLTDEGLSASTVQNTLDPLRVMLRRAMRRDIVSVDPTDGVELRRMRGTRDRIAAPPEAAALLAALPDEDRALWATTFYAGLRRGELRAPALVRRGPRRRHDPCRARVASCAPTCCAHLRVGVHRGSGTTRRASWTRRSLRRAHVRCRCSTCWLTGRRGDALVFGRTDSEPFLPTTVRARAPCGVEARGAVADLAALRAPRGEPEGRADGSWVTRPSA